MSVILAGAITLSMSSMIFAAGISAQEQKILDYAPAKAAELGISTSDSKYLGYVEQAKSYLRANELDATQVSAAMSAMDNATSSVKTVMNEKGVKSIYELKELDASAFNALKNSAITGIKADLKAAGIKGVEISADGTVTVSDVSGNPVTDPAPSVSRTPVKQTGFDMTATAVVAAAVVGAVAACGVVAKKKDLFGAEA